MRTREPAKEASPSPGVQESHAGKEIIFPTPAAGAAPVANLLQDEITWLTQSLARTSKGLGGIFFSEAPNTTALSQALWAEMQFWNETIAFAAGQKRAIDFPQMGGQSSFAQLLGDETNLVMQASAKLAQEQGLIQFPGANPMGASNLASLFGQEARQIDLANATNKPAGSIDFAQNGDCYGVWQGLIRQAHVTHLGTTRCAVVQKITILHIPVICDACVWLDVDCLPIR